MADVAFGDFDCDGRQDAFRTTGSGWEYCTTSFAPGSLGFADVNGDGATDILSMQTVD